MNGTKIKVSNPPSRTGSKFIPGLKAHDEASWGKFYEKYRGRIFGRALAKGLTASEAEEVVQETVLTILRTIDDFVYDRAKGRFSGFVMSTARFKIGDKLRERQLRDRFFAKTVESPQCEEPDRIDQLPGNESSPRQVLEQKEMQEMAMNLSDAVMAGIRARSNPRQYQIFDLRVLKGWPVERVCRALGVRAEEVHLGAHRISRKIQQEIERLRKAFERDPSNRRTKVLLSLAKEEGSCHIRRAY